MWSPLGKIPHWGSRVIQNLTKISPFRIQISVFRERPKNDVRAVSLQYSATKRACVRGAAFLYDTLYLDLNSCITAVDAFISLYCFVGGRGIRDIINEGYVDRDREKFSTGFRRENMNGMQLKTSIKLCEKCYRRGLERAVALPSTICGKIN